MCDCTFDLYHYIGIIKHDQINLNTLDWKSERQRLLLSIKIKKRIIIITQWIQIEDDAIQTPGMKTSLLIFCFVFVKTAHHQIIFNVYKNRVIDISLVQFQIWMVNRMKKVVIFVLRINYYSVIICVQIKIIARNNGCEKLLYNRRKSLWAIKKTFKFKQKDPEQDPHKHKNVMCEMKHSENKMRYVFI